MGDNMYLGDRNGGRCPMLCFFFFQAEDGIRDKLVTGVQTCALPICEPPPCLYDYLPADALLVVDESHVTIPQLGAMYKGDRSRKENLVEYGFRLPSALDNRPLKFEEWEGRAPRSIFVSATPGRYEYEKTGGEMVELLVRPTGLLDPEVEIRPVATQVDDLLSEVNLRVAMGDRVLVTTLTKRMAEN